VFGNPEVFAPAPKHVVVLMGAAATHGDLLFTSTDGGRTFGPGVLVGDEIAPTSAVLVGNQIVETDSDDSNGVQIGAFSITSPAPPVAYANPSKTGGNDGLGAVKGGVMVAGDNASSGPTTVEYAPAGKSFTTTGSYSKVATFSGESFGGVSGNALLTIQTGGKGDFLLRFFNGTKFGAAHVVPGGSDFGPGWQTIDRDPGGVTHVIRSDEHTSPIYELTEYSTTTGAHWTKRVLGNTFNNTFSAGLDSAGSGLVLGVVPARGFPVLAPQTVSFALTHSSDKKGHSVIGKGKGHAASKTRKIELQVEKSGRWYDVASTHESASGAFSFKIKDTVIGTRRYRAVASDHAGYVEFGYSAARSLTVKK
jgi:hypothetical protein